MSIDPGKEAASEFYTIVAVVGAIFGDPNEMYASSLACIDEACPAEPLLLWNQPLHRLELHFRHPHHPPRTSLYVMCNIDLLASAQ